MSAAPLAGPGARASAAPSPFVMLGSDAVPACEGDACVIPGAEPSEA